MVRAAKKVLPTRDLYHPVLHYQEGDKMTFFAPPAHKIDRPNHLLTNRKHVVIWTKKEPFKAHGAPEKSRRLWTADRGYKILHIRIDELWH